ncbi:chromosomal replication initiator protein DnaA [candidate division WWE3 bacterium RIFCSPHIGHO2_01_FULL_48_15]|uniref:Chromosomal replication initiator protein DnaA n=1 Tax=candidate division WWE3 bacterium RIFCSPHIGHO2_01_FULL_48_15 TaxID=1802619 RepID=A0A1F4VC14_UNCKA|nr:MAG: chromosomal replication initiator protein DnaA [candidate division WWE3 bacterium RIFCSPHIGHO2_01_FULL_48_15]
MQEKEIWKNTLSSLETELSKAVVGTFFRGTELGFLENGIAKILCLNRLSADYLRARYGEAVEAKLSDITGREWSLSFEVKPTTVQKPKELGPIFRTSSHDGLFPSYTFENFVVGLSNQLAAGIAQAVSAKPGQLHNPLFLHSRVGLGKTHLMHAIGNAVKQTQPDAEILYCPAERFTNELISAIQDRRSTASFRRKYRSVDVLLVDDIQFLAGREASQEEFFNTFNELYLSGRQVILTSDRNPTEIQKLEERLVSRFSGGMVADIQEPDLDLRLAILKRKAKEREVDIPGETLFALADQLSGNIRQLEGALNQLLTVALAQNTPPSAELAATLGQNVIRQEVRGPEEIISAVARRFQVDLINLRSGKRTKENVFARQVAAHFLRTVGQLSLKKIGELLGGRDHSTILHGLKKVELELSRNPILRNQIDAVRVEILGKTS